MSAVYTQTQMILAVPATFNIWCKLCIGTIALPTTDDTSYVRDDINLRPSLELWHKTGIQVIEWDIHAIYL